MFRGAVFFRTLCTYCQNVGMSRKLFRWGWYSSDFCNTFTSHLWTTGKLHHCSSVCHIVV